MRKSLATSIMTLLVAGLYLSSCTTPQEIQLNFKMTYGDDPLVMFEDVAYADGRKMQFSRISLFASDIELSHEGDEMASSEVEFMKLNESHLSLEDAQSGYQITLEGSDRLLYDKLTFNIGLTPDQNSTEPTDHRSSSPLSKTGEHWPSWSSYVFVKIDGDIDLNDNGEYEPGETFSLHLGTDEATRSISFNLSESKEDYDIFIDIAKVFNNNGAIYNIDGMRQMHSLSDEALANIKILSDNLKDAVSM